MDVSWVTPGPGYIRHLVKTMEIFNWLHASAPMLLVVQIIELYSSLPPPLTTNEAPAEAGRQESVAL